LASTILVVRLGAMGDIIHALPAVASLRESFPGQRIHWAIAPKWSALLEGNPDVDELVPFKRATLAGLYSSWKRFRVVQPEIAVDFHGLIQSALIGWASRPREFVGWDASVVRENLASRFYSKRVSPKAAHVVERNLELVAAAGAGKIVTRCFIPEGKPEGELPKCPFVLTHPFAGWMSKQWPLNNYQHLAALLKREGLMLVANVPPGRASDLNGLEDVAVHTSSLPGLIHATRAATAVLGLDSGPLHLAAALSKPGVALFGPTDPARNGPYGSSIRVLRAPQAGTSYKRRDEVDASMRRLTVTDVHAALINVLKSAESRA
jgi:heptosyltransferase I